MHLKPKELYLQRVGGKEGKRFKEETAETSLYEKAERREKREWQMTACTERSLHFITGQGEATAGVGREGR